MEIIDTNKFLETNILKNVKGNTSHSISPRIGHTIVAIFDNILVKGNIIEVINNDTIKVEFDNGIYETITFPEPEVEILGLVPLPKNPRVDYKVIAIFDNILVKGNITEVIDNDTIIVEFDNGTRETITFPEPEVLIYSSKSSLKKKFSVKMLR